MCAHAYTVISSLFILGIITASILAYKLRDGHIPNNNETCLMIAAIVFINLPYLLQN
ncbi:hypothetical protein BNJ_00314 [Kaumoebavirus]|uniref:hypothetical protein n=1 Tax=Kaumoebavirus TaxID=1859492 RepID=UPI0009C1EF9D|nr:hypothetical protein BNJ_00314 [Kaumoebavirus]ARA72136.1 hypothetical protein BNJ_00314 [Kaumoebavirus]